jgi:hypothetical protein
MELNFLHKIKFIVFFLALSQLTSFTKIAFSDQSIFPMRVNSDFNVNYLPFEIRQWHIRLQNGLKNSRNRTYYTNLAESNNTYNYGRQLNTYITTLLNLLRVTNDPLLMVEVDRLSEILRKQLNDKSIISLQEAEFVKDGFLNWQYRRDNKYFGTDLHEMDEMLTHSLIAAIAYAYHVNSDCENYYEAKAAFWINYLENHFEKKWRIRKNKPKDFPFLEKKLTHVYAQWIRYNYYMAKLTGKNNYLEEALRMSAIIHQHIFGTASGTGRHLTWDHGMPILGTPAHGPQPLQYARYTLQAAADLAMEGFDFFGKPGYMEKLALTVRHFVLADKTGRSFPYRIDGADLGRETPSRFASSPWAMLGRWDPSGEIVMISKKVYDLTEPSNDKPMNIYIPAGIVFSLTSY